MNTRRGSVWNSAANRPCTTAAYIWPKINWHLQRKLDDPTHDKGGKNKIKYKGNMTWIDEWN